MKKKEKISLFSDDQCGGKTPSIYDEQFTMWAYKEEDIHVCKSCQHSNKNVSWNYPISLHLFRSFPPARTYLPYHMILLSSCLNVVIVFNIVDYCTMYVHFAGKKEGVKREENYVHACNVPSTLLALTFMVNKHSLSSSPEHEKWCEELEMRWE